MGTECVGFERTCTLSPTGRLSGRNDLSTRKGPLRPGQRADMSKDRLNSHRVTANYFLITDAVADASKESSSC